ncbi:MAG: DUF2974 domain-containing protein [Firmicutes bacterium]|nr:DUF2974 domain-containing protein [Bacillota bacterium]
MNIIDYIEKNKNKDFNEFKFTEVDNLIFTLIPYLDLTNIVPAFKNKKSTLSEVAKSIQSKAYKGFFISNIYKMIQTMKDTKRYGNTLLYNYMNVVNDEMQFAAITMKLNDNSIYIVYAGTDTSIIGWEEDFKMAYMYPGKSQKYATIYLNKAINLFDKNIRVGGHSKGGNLAICAAMNTNFFNKRKIIHIYNNDGPGFLKEQVLSKAYKSIENKINMYIPEQSIIGLILYHTDNYNVVKSKNFSLLQHDSFNWLCDNDSFVKSKLSKRSKRIEAKLTEKIEQMQIEDRINLVNNLFKIFKDNNIKNIKEISVNNLFQIIKNITSLDKETQNLLIEFILILFIK